MVEDMNDLEVTWRTPHTTEPPRRHTHARHTERLKSQGEASSSSNSLTFTAGQLQVDTKCAVEEEAAAKRLSDRVRVVGCCC